MYTMYWYQGKDKGIYYVANNEQWSRLSTFTQKRLTATGVCSEDEKLLGGFHDYLHEHHNSDNPVPNLELLWEVFQLNQETHGNV